LRTLQLYATGSATANAVATAVIPSATRIKAIQVAFLADGITDNGRVSVELSKTSTSLIASNGALDPFFEIGQYLNFVTSGLAAASLNQTFNVDVECRQGEIIYLHVLVSGTVTYFFNGILWYA
jgi:D-hexose-6-phosphate mutarotase